LILEGHGRGACELSKSVLKEAGSSDHELWFRALKAYASDRGRSRASVWRGGEISFDGLFGNVSRHGLSRALHQTGLSSGELSGQRGLELLCVELALREGAPCGELLHSVWSDGAEEVEGLLVSWRVEFGRSRVALALEDFAHSDSDGWQRLLELSGVTLLSAMGDAGEDLERLACRAGGAGGAGIRALMLEELSEVDSLGQEQLQELRMIWRRVAWALQEADQGEALRSFEVQTAAIVAEREILKEPLHGFPPHPRGLFEPVDVGLLRQ
jgi:hypothetical protein